ncbi:MAG: hypothetical protein ACPLRZ_02820 [Thermovenabulum sp.]|uniref:hypothetical protein n=1 Tax=Thermovenabulum sp. TaxID=3100335 RepID=UPI003C7A9401
MESKIEKNTMVYLLLLSNILGISVFLSKYPLDKDKEKRMEDTDGKEERRENEQKVIKFEEKKEVLLEKKQEKLKPLVWRFP